MGQPLARVTFDLEADEDDDLHTDGEDDDLHTDGEGGGEDKDDTDGDLNDFYEDESVCTSLTQG